jgi:hypothetical protein
MKKIILLLILILSAEAQAGDIIYGWYKVNETGDIVDMSFLPGGDRFLALDENGEFQIRKTETGEVINSIDNINQASFGNFEITPDSNRVIVANTGDGTIATYGLNGISLIKGKFISYDTISTWVTNMAVDPVRPYVYVTVYGRKGPSSNLIQRGQVSVYNYETMELVKHLTDFDSFNYPCIAVSADGKYLSTSFIGPARLMVWDLETFELIRNFKMYDGNGMGDDFRCVPMDIEFSKNNPNNIFISGGFPKMNSEKSSRGLLMYGIEEDNILNYAFKDIYSSLFVFIDDEERVINVSIYGQILYAVNLYINIVEYSKIIDEEKYSFGDNLIYSKETDAFIGSTSQRMTMIRYDRETSIQEEPKPETIIYPNPTNSLVNIGLDCTAGNAEYQISDINAEVIKTGNAVIRSGKLSLDISHLPAGVYFLRVKCNGRISHHKLLKSD